ncbi:MAG: prolyl oligopeptidase family serine peptidase [Ilumatobacteraceae bacterium]
MTVPPTRRDGVVDTLHGVDVPDPYRWLEDGDDPEVRQWVADQNAHTRQALDARPDREWWHERLVALMQLPVVVAVQVRGDHLFCLERPSGAQQFVLTRRSAVDAAAAPVVLVDPVVGTTDATTAIDWYDASEDGSLVAVGTSEGGTENSVLRVVAGLGDDAGRDLGEAIPDTRACSVAWEPDGTGFVYTRYPAGDQYRRTVHHHVLGTPWEDDPVLWAEHPNPQAWPSVSLSADGGWLVVHVQVGWARVDVHVQQRASGAWTTVVEGVEATTGFEVSADGTSLVGLTTIGAPRGRIVRATLDAPAVDRWETLVAEGDAVLSGVRLAGDDLLVVATTDAVDVVRRYDAAGRSLGVVEGLGDVVAVAGVAVDRTAGTAFVVVDAFDTPTALYRASAGASAERWTAPPTPADLPALTVSHIAYPSLDGTAIGLFVMHRTDVAPGPDVPLILNGYGGFAITEAPVWSPHIGAWCAAGGTFAIAGLRGGLEHGEAWHHAGRREHKQNVYDDFHAGADWLVDQGQASRRRLAIYGGSNGGLLVGVGLTQRPDLCHAVWCRVPLLDMIRFPEFLIARLWTSEYGDPEIAEEFGWLHAYSPYHHVVDGTCYPATLFTTAEGDTRVDPLHARKMAALVQAATACPHDRPILLFQEGRAGHGVGKPVAKRADELADGLAFLAWQLGLDATGTA